MGANRVDSYYKAVWHGFLDGLVGFRNRRVKQPYLWMYNEAWNEGNKVRDKVIYVNGHGVLFCKLCADNGYREAWFRKLIKVYDADKAKRRKYSGRRRKIFLTANIIAMKKHLSKIHKSEIYYLIPSHLRKYLVTLAFT